MLTVTDKQEPTAEDIAKNFDQTREQLVNEQREELFRVYVGNLTQKYEEAGAVRYSKKQAAGTVVARRKLNSPTQFLNHTLQGPVPFKERALIFGIIRVTLG